MTVPSDDERMDSYLWDPTAPVDDEVRAIERALAPLHFDPASRPAPARKHPPSRTWVYALAAAVVVLAIAGVLFVQWRWRWPDGRPWAVAAGPVTAPARLAVGAPLLLSGSEEARIQLARIGTLSVKGDTRLTLRSTGGSRHRLVLDHGSVRVRVWAPPGSVNVRTPAGEVIDLGCEFDLSVDEAGETRVIVRSGWVLIANDLGETLVPAGADGSMGVDRRPGAPVFLDASPAFREGVRSLDVDAIVTHARKRDVFTLLVLVQRRSPGSDRLATRAAELSPPPQGVSVSEIVRGDMAGVDRWRETLPLPPPKGWLRNWRDALPWR